MGGTISSGRNNDELVDNLIDADFLKSVALQQIFRAVDRGDYYTCEQREKAYRDSAWRNGNLHLSAPCVYSEVMEALKLKSGLSFLNLGSGSGYLSTMAGLILGTYGINHGIELYPDVVTFANDRLDDFINKSEAIDEYEFCPPKFVVGNCLRIDSSSQLYDRVYCGASCPAEHEIYMKHLIKVGGILVMPLNNKLLQIKRTGESSWESTKVLSVSFAPLLPAEKDPVAFVNLPDFVPPMLQELCRSQIRTILRSHVEKEHPRLQERKKISHRNRDRTQIHRIVIPLVSRSDSGSNSDSDDSANSPPSPQVDRATTLIENLVRGRAQLQEMVDVTGSWRREQSSSSAAESPPNFPRTSTPTEAGREALEEFFNENVDHNTTGRRGPEIYCAASFISEPKESSSSSATAPTSRKQGRKRRAATSQSAPASKRRVLSHPRLNLRRQTATFIWKRIFPDISLSQENKDSEKPSTSTSSDQNEENYRDLMLQKVLALPLPTPLQRYINYRRENI